MFEKEVCSKFKIEKIEVNESLDDWNFNSFLHIKPIMNPRYALYIAEEILKSDIFKRYPYVDSIKLKYKLSNAESLKILEEIAESVKRIFYVDDEYIDDKGAMIEFKVINVVTSVTITPDVLILDFNKEIDKIECLQKIINETIHKINEANQYIIDNPKGFPYIVGWRDKNPIDKTVVSPKIICAFNREEAIRKFIKGESKYLINDFYENEFLLSTAELLYYGDLIIDKIEKDIKTKIDELSEDKFTEFFVKKYNPDELYRLVGKDNFDKMLYNMKREDIFAELGGDIADMLKYNTLEVML